jgi:hypothetical protein
MSYGGGDLSNDVNGLYNDNDVLASENVPVYL